MLGVDDMTIHLREIFTHCCNYTCFFIKAMLYLIVASTLLSKQKTLQGGKIGMGGRRFRLLGNVVAHCVLKKN